MAVNLSVSRMSCKRSSLLAHYAKMKLCVDSLQNMSTNSVLVIITIIRSPGFTVRTDGACPHPNLSYQHRRFDDWVIAPSMPREQRLENSK